MVSVDSSGKTHVSLSEASRGSAAQRTASRDASGAVVGQSSGSNYVRQQEAARAAEQEQKVRDSIQYNPGMPAWASAPGETAGIDRSKLQDFKTKEELEREHSKSYRVKAALKEGYKAGQGKEYNLKGLGSPALKAQELKTYPLYEKSLQVSEKIDTVQNSILSRIPGQGLGKDVLTGVTNIPEMAVGAVGGLPLGLETIARNRGSSIDSTAFGLGVMAGGTVQKAKDHPGELAGELIGSYALGRGLGSVERQVKPSFSRTGLKDFAVNERASLGKMQYAEPKLLNPKNKIETYIEVEGKLVPESSARINSVKLADDVILTPEMEEVLFGKAPVIQETYHISSVRMAENVKLTPEMERVLFSKPARGQSELILSAEKLNRNIFSKEMTAPTDYIIPSARVGVSSPLAYSLPFVSQGNIQQQTKRISEKQTAELKMVAVSLPAVSIPAVSLGQIDKNINKQSLSESQAPYIPPVPIVDSTTKTDIINPPFIPQPSIIPPYNPSNGGIPDPIPSITIIKPPGSKMPIYLDGDLDLSSIRGSKPKRRKTKNKMLKNAYGDISKLF